MESFSEFTRKNVAAVVLGPLALIPTLLLLAYVEVLFKNQSAKVAFGELFPLYTAVGLPFTYLVTLIVGLPTVVILNKLNKLNLLNITLVWLIPLSIFSLFQNPAFIFWVFFTCCAFSVTLSCWGIHKIVA